MSASSDQTKIRSETEAHIIINTRVWYSQMKVLMENDNSKSKST